MVSPMFLIETSILVDLLRGYPPARSWIDGLTPGEAAISVVTAAELIAGCRNQREQKLVEKELASYAILWDSEATSQLAWNWYREYHLSHGMDFLDCLIGAAAHHHGLVLYTLNDRHFAPLPGLHTSRPY
jgi:predicted nucleic acid-binding protein